MVPLFAVDAILPSIRPVNLSASTDRRSTATRVPTAQAHKTVLGYNHIDFAIDLQVNMFSYYSLLF